MPLPIFGSGAEVVALTERVIQAVRLFLKDCYDAFTQIDSVKEQIRRARQANERFMSYIVVEALNPEHWKEITDVVNKCEQWFKSISLDLERYTASMNSFSRVKWASSWKSKTEGDMLELETHLSRSKDLRLDALGACLQRIHKSIQEMRGEAITEKEAFQTMKPSYNAETKINGPASSTPLPRPTARSENTGTIPYPFSAPNKGSNAAQQTGFQPGVPLGASSQEPRFDNAFNSAVPQIRQPYLQPWPSPSAVSPGLGPGPNNLTAQVGPRERVASLTAQVPHQNYKPHPTSSGHANATHGAGTNEIDLQRYLKLPKKSCNRMAFDPFGNETLESKQRRADLAARKKAYSTPVTLKGNLRQQVPHPMQTASTPVPKNPFENRRAGPKYPIVPPSVYTEAGIVPPGKGLAPYPSDAVQPEKKPSKSPERSFTFYRNNIYGQSVPITVQGSESDFRTRLGLPVNSRLPLGTLLSSMDIFIS